MAQVQAHPQSPPVHDPNAAVSGVSGGEGNQFPATSLYVGDLETNVTDEQLYDAFSRVGQVASVRVCRDVTSHRSLCYAYVNFNNPMDAARALDELNFTPLNGKPIRIMYSNRDPSVRRSGTANIFIKNLDKSIDNKALYDTFSVFGNILSCKVATDSSGQSKGYGFVQYFEEESAQSAMSKLNGMLLNDKQVYVGPFLHKHERENPDNNTKFNNVFVKNLSESTTEENLTEIFGKLGTITSVVVMREEDGKSKCFGFVNFENPDDASRAVEELNGKKFDDKEWYVGKAQKKSEREIELKGRFEQGTKEVADKYQGLNLYLKNLDDNIGDDKLRELFSEFGTVTSCKVMRDLNGISKGSGFVAFSSPEEASRALSGMNGKMFSGKPLYVAPAQRKEERKARMEARFSQMRPVAMPPANASPVPMYPPGAPGLGQQLFYGQARPSFIPPQPAFGYQQQLVPGVRPGEAPMPNFYISMLQQSQQAQRPGGPGHHGQQHPVPLLQQQMLPRGRVYQQPRQGRSSPGSPQMPGFPGAMPSAPYDMGGFPPRNGGLPQLGSMGALASDLANATPLERRTMLGEILYPMVDQLEHRYAAKITGMLLEMDQTEVLHLLESPDSLKAKVDEAINVLTTVVQQHGSPTDQLAALSLDDGAVS